MNSQQDLTPVVREWLDAGFATLPAPGDISSKVRAEVHQTPQQRGFLPPISTWRFQSMFSATKFVVAGVIVALFGGFLLTGVLTQQSDEPIPAVGVSVEPTSTADLTAEATATADAKSAPETAMKASLLPGVDLVTEEVEPGIYKVLSDGIRDLSWPVDRPDLYLGGLLDRNIAAGPDGSVWLFWPDESFRIGSPGSARWGHAALPRSTETFTVFSDGRVARMGESVTDTLKVGEAAWGTQSLNQSTHVVLAPDGNIWGVWPVGGKKCDGAILRNGTCRNYLQRIRPDNEDDTLGRRVPVLKERSLRGVEGFWITDDGTMWLLERWVNPKNGRRITSRQITSLLRFDRDGFKKIDAAAGLGRARVFDMGPTGILWAGSESELLRFDGNQLSSFNVSDGFPGTGGHYRGHPGFVRVAPDGSAWVNPRRASERSDGCDGLARFDGQHSSNFLEGQCIFAVDVGPDGSVWVQAFESGIEPWEGEAPDSRVFVHTYVITPEAVAATE